MSEPKSKKTGKINRREERTLKEQQEKRKIRMIAVIVVVVFAILVASALLINSKFIRRMMTAITIGDMNFTATEFDFFYTYAERQYEEIVNNYYEDYASSMLPDNNKPHASQMYDAENGVTWADFYNDYAVEMITEFVQYYKEATAVGFVMPDEAREAIDNEIEMYRSYYSLYGFPSLDAFLQASFGSSINEKSLRSVYEFLNTASEYSKYVYDSLEYTPDELSEYYAENTDDLDIFTYRYFLVASETIHNDDYDTDEELEAAKAEALQASYVRAAQIAGEITSEDDFINAAREYNEAGYSDRDSTLHRWPGASVGDTHGPWLQDSARQPGDVGNIEMSTGCYVIYLLKRDNNDYHMAQMRQILIVPQGVDSEDYEEGEDDPSYLEALSIMDSFARSEAEEVYRLFIDGGADEDALIALMDEYSADTTEGGFYDKISKGTDDNKKDAVIEEWLFAPGRQIGNYELLRSPADGYHLIYLCGYDERYCDFLAENGLRERDYNDWLENLDPVEPVRKWAFVLTQH